MQDISLLPQWSRETVIQNLQKNPLDQKTMKAKLDRIYQISSTNELQYVPDVLDAYCWIKLSNQMDDFKRFFPSQKDQKQFYDDFAPTSIRYMIICRKFRNKVMMVLSQYIMLQCLNLFSKKYQSLQKHLKMINILAYIFDYQKQFYKLSYTVQLPQCVQIQSHKSLTQPYFDDSTDLTIDPEMNNKFMYRAEYCTSKLYMDFLNYSYDKLDMFNIMLDNIEKKKFNIEATSQIIAFLMRVQPFLHKKFADSYINRLVQGILDYVNKGDDITIRNFSKQRYQSVVTSLREFLKRIKPLEQRKQIIQQFQLSLICRFLHSDFLDRKLQSISILTTFIKYSKNSLIRSKEQLIQWIKQNSILKAIYNDKSHEQLITRSSEFLQYYLFMKPSLEQLIPLLQLTDANIKLISENFQYFPEEFKIEIVKKIQEKQNVINKDALNIIKQIQGCEEWLLKNGGECWVEVVREKTKRKTDIEKVFNHEFKVVKKITKEILDLYEGKFKTQYFLHLNQINYVSKVLQNETISLEERIRFAALALQPLSQINETTYNSLLPFTTKTVDQLPSQLQTFFFTMLDKLSKTFIRDLFTKNFSSNQSLSTLGLGQLGLFQKSFLLINQQQQFIQKHTTYTYISPHSYRKQKKQHLTIKVNPNNLIGMENLMKIIYENKFINVSQEALQFVGFLFDRLASNLVDSVTEFKSKILDGCLEQLYKTQDQQEKYLKIVQKLMNQSEKEGVDQVPSINSLFPAQKLTIKIIDHFNVNKSKITLQVDSNLTLYEFRVQIGRTINAYVHQMKLIFKDKQLDPRLNGHVIHTLNLSHDDILIQKKVSIQKVSLMTSENSALNHKAKTILSSIFKQYSTLNLMSKSQCQKYQQRCIGQITSMSQSRVDKIYQQYDTDKDGYLTEEDFLKFYQASALARENAVWSNLETFGVRNDLEILNQQEVKYPDGVLLTRNLLIRNQMFVAKLMQLINSDKQNLAKAAWNIVSRLPLMKKPFSQFNLQNKYSFRYWLYLVDQQQQYNLITKQILLKILHSDIQTTCIGLKIAHQCTQFDIQIFNLTLQTMKNISSYQSLQFHNKVLLDNSLKLFNSCLCHNIQIRNTFITHHQQYFISLTYGLMSHNHDIRIMYCHMVEELVHETVDKDFQLFQVFFNLIYKNFQKCDKATLTIEYFDLYSNVLELLKSHTQLLNKLKLNEQILAESMVQLYKQHECKQTSLNSKPDHVAQGFLRILSKLLNNQTQQILVPFVKYLFQNSLFPQHGQNKLKNSKSRKDAYELIYEICSLKNQQGQSLGLRQLFNAGFKSVYKKINLNKPSTFSFNSYYYNYNQARSQLGYSGIRNLGCICYMISMLQQLFMTPSFRYLILMADDNQPQCLVKKGNKQIDDNIFHQLKNMFGNLELTEKQQYNPDEFCFAFKDFQGNPINVAIQQDAQEFINLFFDKMEWSLKKTPFRRIFQDIYGGRNCNLTVCSNCKAANQRYQNFYPLSLQIKGYKNIEQSFNKYITGQVISDYQCDSCKKKTDVTKSCYLAQTPNYFILHLTRMCFNYDKFQNQKVNSRFQFPQNLNVWDYSLDKQKGLTNTKDQFQYTLKGVVLHYGTADFGHYYSYIKQSQNKWLQFNDQRVRQFDPRDIQSDCFGGENWRRQSQSAYLCVYEKVKKRTVILEFDTEEQKDNVISKFGLKKAVVENQVKIEKKEEEEMHKEEVNQKQTQSQIQPKKQQQKPKILVKLDPSKIPQFVPENLKQKISKANQQFSFSLNLSNDQFAHFIHKILSIQPSSQLTTQYLQLCYECFHLKQIVDEENNTTLSQWAAQRFKKIVFGHGWQFLKNFGKNWQSDILSIQKATRVGMKNLLQCVISDIIQSNNLNNEFQQIQSLSQQAQTIKSQKRTLILQFLQKYTQMLSNQVIKHWHRFRQYFQVWHTLVNENSFVRRYCEEKMLIQKIFDFVLEDQSPFTRNKKKLTMGNSYYSPEFDCPLELMTLLIKHGYELNQMEVKCTKYYAFMSKIINFPTKHFDFVEYLCKNDDILSQKMAYLILNQASRVNQSDYIKPIISVIHKFLKIEDNLKQKRKQWILGIPQYLQNPKTLSYGIYNLNPDQQMILTYFSPVRAHPIFLLLIRFKSKAQHVAALLISMLLQLQHDGIILNLQQYPSMQAFQQNYIYWFKEFIQSYYQQTHRAYMGKHYVEYGNRLQQLWIDREKKQYEKNKFYLIGKTIAKNHISEEIQNDVLMLKVEDVVSELLQITQDNKELLNKKMIKKYDGSQSFRVKHQSHSRDTYFQFNRSKSGSQSENQNQQKPLINPFDNKISAVLFRKLTIKNISDQNLLITIQITQSPGADGLKNTIIPQSPISFQIRGGGDASTMLTIMKKDINKEFGELKYNLKLIGKATRQGYWPRQIITPVPQEDKVNVVVDSKAGSSDQSNQEWP